MGAVVVAVDYDGREVEKKDEEGKIAYFRYVRMYMQEAMEFSGTIIDYNLSGVGDANARVFAFVGDEPKCEDLIVVLENSLGKEIEQVRVVELMKPIARSLGLGEEGFALMLFRGRTSNILAIEGAMGAVVKTLAKLSIGDSTVH